MSRTREEMEAIIKSGRSVLYRGQVLSSLSQLPSAVALAKGNTEREAAVRRSLEAQRDALDAQLATLDRPAPAPSAPAPAAPASKAAKHEPKD